VQKISFEGKDRIEVMAGRFSQIQDKVLHIKMRQPDIEYRLFLFATNYNVFISSEWSSSIRLLYW
jgi:hypothetical protein